MIIYMNLMYTQTPCLNLRHTHSFNILDCNNMWIVLDF